jgi:hypothetical protein
MAAGCCWWVLQEGEARQSEARRHQRQGSRWQQHIATLFETSWPVAATAKGQVFWARRAGVLNVGHTCVCVFLRFYTVTLIHRRVLFNMSPPACLQPANRQQGTEGEGGKRKQGEKPREDRAEK